MIPSGTHHQLLPIGSNSSDKLLFFERAKRTLEPRPIYEEFLKLLGLFSKNILDVKTLIDRAQVFLGEGELMVEFKELMGWDSRQENVENGPPGSIRTGPPEALSAQPVDDGQGPSYRRLPDSVSKHKDTRNCGTKMFYILGNTTRLFWPG
jgi:paired amphipathic helix protein Sin3a